MDKYNEIFTASKVEVDDAAIKLATEKLVADNIDKYRTKEVYKQIYNCIDLTTLATTDSHRSVTEFVDGVNAFEEEHPELGNVAAICVYPNFAATVTSALEVSGVGVAAVAAAFPSAQTFAEIKTTEIALAVLDGATEIDVVMNLGYLLEGNYEELADELAELKMAAKDATLKVIIETGALKTAENIKRAALMAIYSGADFVKTSTGKVYDGANIEAVYTICQIIKEYHAKFGTKIGVKVSGGVVTTEDALQYYTVASEILGEEWMNNQYFRIGASRLATYILEDIFN
ncbi:MAG: deoxyribose-phosphate aldolase [Bacteroidales bacterium]